MVLGPTKMVLWYLVQLTGMDLICPIPSPYNTIIPYKCEQSVNKVLRVKEQFVNKI